MLNGVAPLLVITFKNKGLMDFFGPDSVAGSLVSAIGIPIPIYLDEKLTGIFVQSETRGIDVNTRVEPVTEKDPLTLEVQAPIVSQTATDSQVTIEMVAKRDSVLLVAIIALMEQIVNRLVSAEYSIHYLNGPTAIFGGLLHRFSTNANSNEDKIGLELVISTAAKESPTPKTPISAVEKVTGAVPL